MISMPLRIVIVDDEAPARSRLRDLLADCEATLPLEIAGEAASGPQALEMVVQQRADVVLHSTCASSVNRRRSSSPRLTMPMH